MADCPRLVKCIFFNDRMAQMPSMADIFKQGYCRSDFERCARFVVAARLGPENVPGNLYPNDQDVAKKLIAG